MQIAGDHHRILSLTADNPSPSFFIPPLELNLPRYKFVVHGVIGEQRGEGAKVAARCLWDSDTDALAREVYVTVRGGEEQQTAISGSLFLPCQETLFCVLTAYGVYYY